MSKKTEVWLLNLCVAVGGIIGAWGRYFTGNLFSSAHLTNFPYATLSVNIVGGLLIGIVVALMLTKWRLSEYWRVFIAVGVCGGLTTFSSFSLETLEQLIHGHWGIALLNIVCNLVLSVVAVALGYGIVLKCSSNKMNNK